MIQHKTWKDVEIPPFLVNTLKNIKTGEFLDATIYTKVFGNRYKSSIKFTCANCSYQKTNARLSEDYPACLKCGSMALSANMFPLFKEIPRYSEGEVATSRIISTLIKRYKNYYKISEVNQKFITLDTNLDQENKIQYIVKFISGEPVIEKDFDLAVCKAAILCPFLWDDTYDSKSNYHKNKMKQSHITQLLYILATCGTGYQNNHPDVDVEDYE